MKKISSFAFVVAASISTFTLPVLAGSVTTLPNDPQNLPRLFDVNSGRLLRGAQPTELGIRELAAAHVKTVLDLRDEKDLIKKEAAVVQAAGMNFISVPLSGFWEPKDKDIALIEEIMNRPDLQPIFIHCKLGEDRSGLVIGLYRVFTQHVDPRTAYAEMKTYGFHPALVFLKHYFDEKTGL